MPGSDLNLALRIRADVQQAVAGMRKMDRSIANIDQRGKRADRTLRSLGRTVLRLGAAYLGLRAAIGIIRSIVGATEEQAQAVAQVERGLRNLDRQTTLTSAGLQAHAAALQGVTTTGDEAILRLQALLLTFRKIDDTNFNRVTEAALDMAAALGQAPRDAALQLAKALEDPAQGLTALRRSGTVFSAEQTDVIKSLAETNRLAQAQALILEEVERQYRGAVQAQRETVGGAGAAFGNAFGDLLEARDGAEDLRVEIEGLTAAIKDPGFASAIRAGVGLLVSLLADAVGFAGDLTGYFGDAFSLASGGETRAARVRDFATSGEGLTLEDVRGDRRLREIAETQLTRLRETIAQQDAVIAERDSALFRQEQDIAAANRAALAGADLGTEARLRGQRADEERAGLNELQAGLRRQREAEQRLVRLLSLADAGNVPSGFTLPGPLPARFRPGGPAGPSDEEVKAAETAAGQIEAALAASQDRLAELTLGRIARIDREERLAVEELRALGETRGVDAAQVEAAITATAKAAEAERHQVRLEALAADHDALVDSLEAGEEARRRAREETARAHADAVADIEAAEVELGIVGAYEAALVAANRWRDATLAQLDAAGAGHEALRDRVIAAHLAMVEAAQAAARDQEMAGRSWVDGVRAGLIELREESTDAAQFAREQTIDAFRSMEDAIVEFVTTGKVSFSSFVDSVIADLARLAVRRAITEPLAEALFGVLAGLGGGGPAPGADAFRRLQAGVGHTGTVAGASGGASRTVPAAIFAGAPRFHAGGIAGGLRPDEVPIITRRGEGIFTPEQMRALGSPNVTVNIENRGTPHREVGRRVELDPRGAVVSIMIDDLDRNGPISQHMRRSMGVRGNAV